MNRCDVIDLQLDQNCGACNGNAADQKSKPEVIPEQKTADGRRKDQTEVGTEIKHGICPLSIFCVREISNQGIVARLFHALENSRSNNQNDYGNG